MHRGRLAATCGLGLTALAGMVWLGAAIAGDPPPSPSPPAEAGPLAAAVGAGTHHRIDGPRGPIHVWIPDGYRPDTGATIVYVHGYWDTVDSAWTKHQLPQQFALGALDAIYIAPEAPSQPRVPVNYPDLGELLRIVEDHTKLPRGMALTVAIGHSGAYRTLEAWMDEPLLDQIVMVDAMYGDEDAVVRWVSASDRRRLIMVGEDTILGTEAVADRLPTAVTLDQFPPAYDLWPAEARAAQVLYVRAQFRHMALVDAGVALPSLLRQLPVPQLATLPWQLPLGALPPLPDAAPGDATTDAR